jgi:hypothetical protein
MSVLIVDTNVPIVANGGHPGASLSCTSACISALVECRKNRIAIDDGYLILSEYRRHLAAQGQPGIGDAFFKWLWDNHRNENHCMCVPITAHHDPKRCFNEFPDDSKLDAFDSSDKKFVAVALSCGEHPTILNATDSDWWDFKTQLAAHGVTISFLCPERYLARTR